MPCPSPSTPSAPTARRGVRRWARAGTAAQALAVGVGLLLAAFGTRAQTPFDESEIDPNSPEVPREIRGLEVTNKLGDHIPLDLTFTQVDGTTTTLAPFFNQPTPDGNARKPVVMMMVYLRCPILCPMVLEKFTATLNQLDFTAGTEYDALVITFDPRDTTGDIVRARAEQLLSYRQPTTDSIRAGWNLLSCHQNPRNARILADALGFPYRYLKDTGEFAHGAAVFVLTPEGKLSRYLLGLDYPARDVRMAILEASQGRVGTLLDRFTLWCYHFDASRGVYTLAAMRVMQVGASLAAVALAVVLILLFRHERRRRRRREGGADAAPAAHVSPAPPLAAQT